MVNGENKIRAENVIIGLMVTFVLAMIIIGRSGHDQYSSYYDEGLYSDTEYSEDYNAYDHDDYGAGADNIESSYEDTYITNDSGYVTYDYYSAYEDGRIITTWSGDLYDAPSYTANYIGTVGAAGEFDYYGHDNGWYAIPWVQGTVAYLPDVYAFESEENGLAIMGYGVITTTAETLVYTGPGTDYMTMGSVDAGTVLVYASETDGWYEIFYRDNRGAYVPADHVGRGYYNEVF